MLLRKLFEVTGDMDPVCLKPYDASTGRGVMCISWWSKNYCKWIEEFKKQDRCDTPRAGGWLKPFPRFPPAAAARTAGRQVDALKPFWVPVDADSAYGRPSNYLLI